MTESFSAIPAADYELGHNCVARLSVVGGDRRSADVARRPRMRPAM